MSRLKMKVTIDAPLRISTGSESQDGPGRNGMMFSRTQRKFKKMMFADNSETKMKRREYNKEIKNSFGRGTMVWIRGYDAKKIMENIECEIMDVVKLEAFDSYDKDIIVELKSESVEDM
ncbi:hypothetical protein BC830DRAFT_1082704 [Chytriomyces sp. MP71]|nr:hypothetical protein BC830DRAFT_1082704 [Chytriomyces sp. MP71]